MEASLGPTAFFPDAPEGDLLPPQGEFLRELRSALAQLEPAYVEPSATSAGITEGGDLYAGMPHSGRDDVAVECFAGPEMIIVGVDPVSQLIDRRVFREPERRIRAAVGFVAALLSGFERRLVYRNDRLVRAQLIVPQPRGGRHKISARLAGPGIGRRSVEREWISFLDETPRPV